MKEQPKSCLPYIGVRRAYQFTTFSFSPLSFTRPAVQSIWRLLSFIRVFVRKLQVPKSSTGAERSYCNPNKVGYGCSETLDFRSNIVCREIEESCQVIQRIVAHCRTRRIWESSDDAGLFAKQVRVINNALSRFQVIICSLVQQPPSQ